VCNLLTNLAFLSGLKNPKLADFKSLNLLDTSLLAKATSASEYFSWGDKSVYSETGRFVVAFLVPAPASENFKGFAKCLPSVVVFILVELSLEFGSMGKLAPLGLAVDSWLFSLLEAAKSEKCVSGAELALLKTKLLDFCSADKLKL